MFDRPKRIYTDVLDIENYIEDNDVYNSKLLYYLQDSSLSKKEYVVKTPFRTDLIAKEFYHSERYEPYVIFQLRIPIEDLTRGLTIELIEKDVIDYILTKLIN